VRPYTVRRPRLALGDGAATRVSFSQISHHIPPYPTISHHIENEISSKIYSRKGRPNAPYPLSFPSLRRTTGRCDRWAWYLQVYFVSPYLAIHIYPRVDPDPRSPFLSRTQARHQKMRANPSPNLTLTLTLTPPLCMPCRPAHSSPVPNPNPNLTLVLS